MIIQKLFVFLEYKICPEDERLGALVMEALTTLLASNVQNANVFRECGGARCAHNLVPYMDCRYQALGIVRELILSAGGDDDMATLLGVMHSAPSNALVLKTHILKVSLIDIIISRDVREPEMSSRGGNTKFFLNRDEFSRNFRDSRKSRDFRKS